MYIAQYHKSQFASRGFTKANECRYRVVDRRRGVNGKPREERRAAAVVKAQKKMKITRKEKCK